MIKNIVKKNTIMILALVLAFSFPINAYADFCTDDTPLIKQEKSNWCMFACGEMYSKSWGEGIAIPQKEIAKHFVGTDDDPYPNKGLIGILYARDLLAFCCPYIDASDTRLLFKKEDMERVGRQLIQDNLDTFFCPVLVAFRMIEKNNPSISHGHAMLIVKAEGYWGSYVFTFYDPKGVVHKATWDELINNNVNFSGYEQYNLELMLICAQTKFNHGTQY